jgi:dolichol-phosphate mannosyltransferase
VTDIFELPAGCAAEVFRTDSATALYADLNAKIDLTLFVSCYNEQEFIVQTLQCVCNALQALRHLTFEIIVIDDRSTDGSPSLVKVFLDNHPDIPITLRCNAINRGLSQNYIDASFIGRGTHYRLVCGDSAEPEEAMREIYSLIGSADIIIPYYPDNGSGRSLRRRLISKMYVRLINALTVQQIRYYNGLPVHRRFHVMRWHPTTRGFGFQADIICMLLEQGYSYKEVPIDIVERKRSNSTALTFANFLSVAHTVTNIIIRRLARRVYEGNRKPRTLSGSH